MLTEEGVNAGVRTVHRVGHKGLSVMQEPHVDFATDLKMVLHLPDFPNKHPNSWVHCSASLTIGVVEQAACVTRLMQ